MFVFIFPPAATGWHREAEPSDDAEQLPYCTLSLLRDIRRRVPVADPPAPRKEIGGIV